MHLDRIRTTINQLLEPEAFLIEPLSQLPDAKSFRQNKS